MVAGDVGPQPAGQGPGALVVGAVQPPIGPLIQQGLVEPLDLAIGLRTIRASSLAADPEPGGGLSEDDRLGVGLGVVGQDPLDPDPVLGKEGGCLDQEPGGCVPLSSPRTWLKATRERSSTAE